MFTLYYYLQEIMIQCTSIVFELLNRKQVYCIQCYFQRFKKDVESLFGKDGQKLASMTLRVCYYDTHY